MSKEQHLVRPLQDARAERLAALNLIEDAIAARRQAEEASSALRESEGRLRQLLNTMDEAFVVQEKVADAGGRIVDWKYVEWNPSFLRHTGISDPANKTVREAIPGIEPIWIDRFASVLRTGQPDRFQGRVESLDRWLDMFVSPVGGPESGRVALVFADVSERHRAEEALRANEEQFRRALEDAPIPVIMHAEDGEILQVSRAWTEWTGYTAQEISSFDAWLEAACRTDAGAVRKYIRQLFRGSAPKEGLEIEVISRTRETARWSFSASAPGRLRDGRRYIVGMALDVTQRAEELRAANRDLHELSKRLVAAQETERRKIAETLHDDIGQVLTALILVLKRARQGNPSEIKNAETLVADLLERVRGLSMELRPHILDNLGLAVALRWHAKRFSEHTKLPVEISVRGIPRVLDNELATTVFRIVQEALTNVARHSGARRASVRVAKRSKTLYIAVSDDGSGFDPDKERRNASGLANLRERVRLNGGEFAIEAKPRRGTTIRATFRIT